MADMILVDAESAQSRDELADVVARLAERVSPRSDAVVRADAAAAGQPDDALRQRLIHEVGVLGLTVPEALGGAGVGLAEAAVVFEILGRRTAAVPLLGSFLAVEALLAGDEAVRDRHLEAIVDGSRRATVWWGAGLRVEESDGGVQASGTAERVIDGSDADLLIAPSETAHGTRWVVIDLDAVPRQRLETLDLVRDLTTITLDGAPAMPIGDEGIGRRLRDVAVVVVAAEQLGVAEQALDDAVQYAAIREQFRRVIGSFQSVKHLLADVAVEADLARSMVEHAVWAASASPDELPEAAAMALVASSRAAVLASAENVQVHGGIGFSWEHPAHLLFRKARSNEHLLESPYALANRILAARGVVT